MAKQETIKVKEKDIVILRFDGTFPITEPDLHAMMKTIRDAVNKDQTIVNRFICLANGISIEDVLGSVMPNRNVDVELNKKDDDGNTWKPISDEDYEKAKKGEL